MRILGFEITRAESRSVVQGNGIRWLDMLPWMWGKELQGGAEAISEQRSLTITAVYTAVRIRCGTMSSLPLHVMKRTDRGREFALTHWAYPLLHDSPNEYHTTSTWVSLIEAHRALWGNSYHRIEWLNNGKAGALLPLMPWEVKPFIVKDGQRVKLFERFAQPGELVYQHDTASGREYFGSDEILHVPGLGFDGLEGMSVIRYNSGTLGTAKAQQNFRNAFFRNGAKPGAILETPGRMKEDAQRNLAKSINQEFGSAENAFKVLVLEQGAKLHTYTMPLQDAQLIEGEKLTRAEIFGLFGIPPHLAGDTERQTSWGTGLGEMDVAYSKHTILPICTAIEQEFNRKLFGRGAREYAKFNLAGLERGDFVKRMEGLAKAVGGPFLTREEARDLEDWPISGEPGADKLLTPSNYGVGATPAAPSKPNSSDGAPGGDDDMRSVTVNVAPPSVNFGDSPEERRRRDEVEQTRIAASESSARELAASNRELAAAIRGTPAPVVNVAPAVNVSAARPIVNVSPEIRNEVRVPPAEVNVHLPARKSVSVVERVGGNKDGDIERITQTEKDV